MYSIKRGASVVATVRPESGIQKQKIMGENVVDMTFTLTSPVAFEIGDTVVVYGQTYVLNTLPTVSKTAEKQIKYTCQFESVGYDLSKALFMFYDENEGLTVPEFSLIGNAEVFIDLIIANANRDQSGWSKGVIEETPIKNLTFSGENCSAVLSTLAVEFENEFWIEGKTIHFTKKGEDSGLTFAYGKGNGLYNVDRSNINSSGLITRLYAFGGERNVQADYGSKRLKIDPIENNVEAFGVIEGVVNFDDVYPKRIGTVSAVDGHLKFSDSGIDFNVNDQLMPGVTAKVQFLTGDLAGYELELTGYNHSTKQFTLKVVEEEKAIEVPSALLKAAVGDTYQLVDIIMPSSYVTAAEEELEERAVAYMAINSVPRVQYSVNCDPLHFKREGIALSLGELVTIEDAPLGIEELIRVVGLERSIILDGIEQYKYTLELSESVQPSRVVREAVREERIDKLVKLNRLDDLARARNNWRTTAELTTMLEALKAEMLLIMVDGSAFETNVFATVGENSFATTAGTLVNAQYEGTWTVASSNNTLASNVPYYVYVKASKSASTATIVISASKIAVDEVSGFYHFLYGIISSKVSGTRIFTSTKGYTRIVGDNIQTGSIISVNGRTYFDLDNGIISLADNAGMSGNGTENTAIRFWAGASYEDKDEAPFRVNHLGKMFASEAEISGKITAGAGSVIGGVEIGSDGKFNLSGSKVEIKPDEGIEVKVDGYADFDKAQMTIPTVTQTPSIGKAAIWIGNLSGIGDDPSSGTVVSIGISVPLGMQVSNSPITSSGVIAITMAGGYAIPLAADTAKGVTAHSWGNHASAGYAIASALANSATITASTTHGAANTIVRRDANGYTNVSYINYSAGLESGTVVSMMAKIAGNGDYLYPVSKSQIRAFLEVPTNNNELTNGAGYITGINSSMVTAALGYTPVNKAGDVMTGELIIDKAVGVLQRWSFSSVPSNFNLTLRSVNSGTGIIDYVFDMVNNGITYNNILRFSLGRLINDWEIVANKVTPSTLVIPTSAPALVSGQAAIHIGNLSGIGAAPSYTWNGQVYVNSEGAINSYLMGYKSDGSWGPVTAAATASWLGLNNYLLKSGGIVQGTGTVLNVISTTGTFTLGLGYNGIHGEIGGSSNALYVYSANGGMAYLNASSAWVAASDVARKKDIEPYELGLDAILQLSPKKFRYKSQMFYERKNTGFIAQEVQSIIEAAYCENNDFIGLDYNAFIPVLVNAVKTLHARVLELEGGVS